MRQIAFVAVVLIAALAIGPIHADYVRVIKDPSECEQQSDSCQSCEKKRCNRCKRCRPCYVRSCNPYKRSCVDDDYDEPAASWPAYWDQPLMEELSR